MKRGPEQLEAESKKQKVEVTESKKLTPTSTLEASSTECPVTETKSPVCILPPSEELLQLCKSKLFSWSPQPEQISFPFNTIQSEDEQREENKLICLELDNVLCKHSFILGSYDQIYFAKWYPRTFGLVGPYLLKDKMVVSAIKDNEYAYGQPLPYSLILPALADKYHGLKNASQMHEIISYALAKGHKVAITAHILYPEIVLAALYLLGLREDEISQICIVGGFPTRGKPGISEKGKEEHIAAAMKHFGIKNRANVLLADTYLKDLEIAKTKGIVVQVPWNREAAPTYFADILKFLRGEIRFSPPGTAPTEPTANNTFPALKPQARQHESILSPYFRPPSSPAAYPKEPKCYPPIPKNMVALAENKKPVFDRLNQVKPTPMTDAAVRLLCLDVDGTLVNEQFHAHFTEDKHYPPTISTVGARILKDGKFIHSSTALNAVEPPVDPRNSVVSAEEIRALISHKDTGLKNGPQMRDSISRALANGHKVAITSMTLFPEVIVPILQAMKLADDEISQIYVVTGFPLSNDPNTAGKEEHIQVAMDHFKITDRNKVMLVDDSLRNIQEARAKNVPEEALVLVPSELNPDPSYFNKINAFFNFQVKEKPPILFTQRRKPPAPASCKEPAPSPITDENSLPIYRGRAEKK